MACFHPISMATFQAPKKQFQEAQQVRKVKKKQEVHGPGPDIPAIGIPNAPFPTFSIQTWPRCICKCLGPNLRLFMARTNRQCNWRKRLENHSDFTVFWLSCDILSCRYLVWIGPLAGGIYICWWRCIYASITYCTSIRMIMVCVRVSKVYPSRRLLKATKE